MALRFRRLADGSRQTCIDGVTYTATHYPSGGPGTRAYWTIQCAPALVDYDREGNDWYCDSWAQVRAAIDTYAQRLRENPAGNAHTHGRA